MSYLTEDHIRGLTMVALLVTGIFMGMPIGILIAKDWKR